MTSLPKSVLDWMNCLESFGGALRAQMEGFLLERHGKNYVFHRDKRGLGFKKSKEFNQLQKFHGWWRGTTYV